MDIRPGASPLLRPGDRIVCIGDSITADPDGYVALCRDVIQRAYPEAGIELINAGFAGQTAAEMALRFQRDVLSRTPTWVTISAGTNDAARAVTGQEPEQMQESQRAFERMCALAETAGIRIALCTPTAFEDHWQHGSAQQANKLLSVLTEWLEELAAARGHLLVPMFEMCRRAHAGGGRTNEAAVRLTTDGVHMTPQGRYLMALTMLAALGVGRGINKQEDDIPCAVPPGSR